MTFLPLWRLCPQAPQTQDPKDSSSSNSSSSSSSSQLEPLGHCHVVPQQQELLLL